MNRNILILRIAHDILLERGWIQGERRNPDGVCLSYAICLAIHAAVGGSTGREFQRLYRSASRHILSRSALRLVSSPESDPLVRLNDHPDAYKEHILWLLH